MKWDFVKNKMVPDGSTIPPQFKGLYEEKDGKFHLKSEDPVVGGAIEAITQLNVALANSRKESEDHKAKIIDLSPLSTYGQDIDTIKTGFEKKLDEVKKAAGKSGEEMDRRIEKVKADLSSEHVKETDSHKTRNKALQEQLYNLLVTDRAKSALLEQKAVDPDLALPFIKNNVKVVEKDGEFQVNVVDDAGDTRFSGKTGQPMTVSERVAEMKGESKYKLLFKSDERGGTGTKPGASGQRPPSGKEESEDPNTLISQGVEDLEKR